MVQNECVSLIKLCGCGLMFAALQVVCVLDLKFTHRSVSDLGCSAESVPQGTNGFIKFQEGTSGREQVGG